MLVGELPKPAGLLDTLSRSPIVCGPLLSLLGLIFPPVRVAEQVIHVCLDRHGLPHIRLGVTVFSIERFFLVRKLPALLFQRVHLRELRPVQKLIDRCLCRPVVGQLRLVLGQIFF